MTQQSKASSALTTLFYQDNTGCTVVACSMNSEESHLIHSPVLIIKGNVLLHSTVFTNISVIYKILLAMVEPWKSFNGLTTFLIDRYAYFPGWKVFMDIYFLFLKLMWILSFFMFGLNFLWRKELLWIYNKFKQSLSEPEKLSWTATASIKIVSGCKQVSKLPKIGIYFT